MEFINLCNILKENNLKLTSQRKAILITLYENKNMLMSAEDILEKSKINCKKLNISTIYRNIDSLDNLKLLYKHVTDTAILYKLKLDDSDFHQMICTECGKVESIDFCPLPAFKDFIDKRNFSLKAHKLELFGHCEECTKKDE